MPDQFRVLENLLLLETKSPKPIHYLERPDIINLVGEISPELLTLLQHCVHPQPSNHPDTLEQWENMQRDKRTARLFLFPPPYALQALLYEECFGVNATPGVNEKFMCSVAPTPGGLISHAQPRSMIDVNGSIEKIFPLDLSGNSLTEIFAKQPDYQTQSSLATAIAQSTYPPEFRNDHYESLRNSLKNRLSRQPIIVTEEMEQDIQSWALRYLRLVQKIPSLLEPINDESLAPMIGLIHSPKRTKLEYWYMLWTKMSGAFLDNGNYKDANDPAVVAAIKTLLTIRTHPEFQDLFSYLSPSGYLNEES